MYSLVQVYIMIILLGLYALIGVIPIMLVMAAITYITKDKAYFRRKIDEFIGGNYGE